MLFKTSSFEKTTGPVTFLLYDLNDVDIQQILEFKVSFGKYHPVFPKNPSRIILRHPVYNFYNDTYLFVK